MVADQGPDERFGLLVGGLGVGEVELAVVHDEHLLEDPPLMLVDHHFVVEVDVGLDEKDVDVPEAQVVRDALDGGTTVVAHLDGGLPDVVFNFLRRPIISLLWCSFMRLVMA